MPSRFAAVTNKEISQIMKQTVPEIQEEGDEARFGSFNRYFLLEFIDKTGEKVFVYKCQLSLSLALLYFVDLFINKLKTKFNNLFLQNDFKCKKNSQLLLKNHPFCAQLSHCFSTY